MKTVLLKSLPAIKRLWLIGITLIPCVEGIPGSKQNFACECKLNEQGNLEWDSNYFKSQIHKTLLG